MEQFNYKTAVCTDGWRNSHFSVMAHIVENSTKDDEKKNSKCFFYYKIWLTFHMIGPYERDGRGKGNLKNN